MEAALGWRAESEAAKREVLLALAPVTAASRRVALLLERQGAKWEAERPQREAAFSINHRSA